MEVTFLDFPLKRYLCPYCGEWHECSDYKHFGDSKIKLPCPKLQPSNNYSIFFLNDYLYFSVDLFCRNFYQTLEGRISVSSIEESNEFPRITFDFNIAVDDFYFCRDCIFKHQCNIFKLACLNPGNNIKITLGFEFSEDEKSSTIIQASQHEEKLQEQEQRSNQILSENTDLKKSENTTNILHFKENKEEVTMKKTTIWEQLYEHSPKENVEIAKEWGNKHSSSLKWAIPVISIYAAYRILKSKDSNLNVNNIYDESKDKLGFTFDSLKDKKALIQLLTLGGAYSAAYVAIKTSLAIKKKENKSDLTIEDVEDNMNKLDTVAKKYNWIIPQTEVMLPLATSVIIVYLMTQKPKWLEYVKEKASDIGGNLFIRASVYLEMAKAFIANKLHIDLSNESENQKFTKFALLATVVGIAIFLYGTKILGDKAISYSTDNNINKKMEAFVSQLLSIMENLLPTAFAGITTFLVTKHILKSKEDENVALDKNCIETYSTEYNTPDEKNHD